ncbi:MAG: hypothetical protein KF850_14390 [Labilithrix sp.]|nr:hypothetical protein [Labilithrix sp.]
MWNSDILGDLDPGALASAQFRARPRRSRSSRARQARKRRLGEDGRIVRLFGREAIADERAGADFIGVHVVGGGLRSSLLERGCLVGDVYIPALRAGARLAAHRVATPFVDVGSLAAYVGANRAWLAARGVRSWIAPGARVSASVDGSIVGAGAIVAADALRSVVWPGAHVREPVADAVVTPHGTVRLPA